jgi:hypothetical protein
MDASEIHVKASTTNLVKSNFRDNHESIDNINLDDHMVRRGSAIKESDRLRVSAMQERGAAVTI